MQFERVSMRPRAAVTGIFAFICVGLTGSAQAGSFSEYLFPGGANPGAYAPSSGIVIDSNGHLWGTTSRGGDDDSWIHDAGTIFELVPPSRVSRIGRAVRCSTSVPTMPDTIRTGLHLSG